SPVILAAPGAWPGGVQAGPVPTGPWSLGRYAAGFFQALGDVRTIEGLDLNQTADLVGLVHRAGLAPGGSDHGLVVTLAQRDRARGCLDRQPPQGLGDRLVVGLAGLFDCR